MDKQTAIQNAANAADTCQQSNNLDDLHTMQRAVQDALDRGASLQDIAAARASASPQN